MSPATIEQAAQLMRQAYVALLGVKSLVDNAATTVRRAELDAIGLAMGRGREGDPIVALQSATSTLQSQDFQTALLQAQDKIDSAVAYLLNTKG